MPEFIPISPVRNFLAGRQNRLERDSQQQGNALAQMEIERGQQFNALAGNPNATPDQFARLGRSDVANALTNIQNSGAERTKAGQIEKARQIYAGSERVLLANDVKGAAQALFPDLVAQFEQMHGPGSWGALPPEQAKALVQAGRDKSAMLLGLAPERKFETVGDFQNPGAGIYQRDPTTGELRQVTAPQRPNEPPAGYRYAADGNLTYVPGGPADPKNRSDRAPPSGYRWTKDGGLEAIKGGPNDPTGPGARKAAAPLRKEFRTLESVKAYETSLPLIKSAEKAPDTGYGDLQLIYTAGKVLDPGSVVREGELALTVAAGSPLQRIIGKTRFTLEKGGRLTPAVREQILDMLNERVGAYKQAYDQDRQTYTQYASDAGLDPMAIVGKHPDDAYGGPRQPAQSAAPSGSAQEVTATGPNGQKIVLRNGQWVPLGR